MKNTEFILKISKHPLIEKVSKLEGKQTVANIIVEEMMLYETSSSATASSVPEPDESTTPSETPSAKESEKDSTERESEVEGHLKSFLKFLQQELAGNININEGVGSKIENVFNRLTKLNGPEKIKNFFLTKLTDYLKASNAFEDSLTVNDVREAWDNWTEQEAKKTIIAAYTVGFTIKTELTGESIQKLAQELVVDPQNKINEFIDEIAKKAAEKIKNNKGAWQLGLFDLSKEFLEKLYTDAITDALNEKLQTQELIKNNKFLVLTIKKLDAMLREEYKEAFAFLEEKILKKLGKACSDDSFPIVGREELETLKTKLENIKNDKDLRAQDILGDDLELGKKAAGYLIEEEEDNKDKKLRDFYYKYLIPSNSLELRRDLDGALTKIANFIKKNKGELNESIKNVKNRFKNNNNNLANIYNGAGVEDEEQQQLEEFFKYETNVDYFIKRFFKNNLEEPETTQQQDKSTYSFMVLRALKNQTKENKNILKTFYKALDNKIEKLQQFEDKKSQTQKYVYLKKEASFLYTKLIKYEKIIDFYITQRSKDIRKEKNVFKDILQDFTKKVFEKEDNEDKNIENLVDWANDSTNLIQYPDKTIEASVIYSKDLKWNQMEDNDKNKSKAFLYDYRTLVREDGEIKSFINRLKQIDNEITTGTEQKPKDEKADLAITDDQYKYYIEQVTPIIKFLQETPITFDGGDLKYGKESISGSLDQMEIQLKDFISFSIETNRKEIDKSKLFNFIGSPGDANDAKQKINSLIEIYKTIQQKKNEGLANDEITYEAFIKEVNENLLYFKMGWPLFKLDKSGVYNLSSPYADNKELKDKFEEIAQKLKFFTSDNPQAKKALKDKYNGNTKQQQDLTNILRELTKLRTQEIYRDCDNILPTKSEDQKSKPAKDPNWATAKELINASIFPKYGRLENKSLVDMEDKDLLKKYLEDYKKIVQYINGLNLDTLVTQNKLTLETETDESIREQITKLIKPLIREKLKRKQK